MDAREAPARQVGGDDAITTRIGAAMLPLAVVVLVVSEALHPGREDPMDFPAVFREYAQRATSGPPFTSASTSAFSCFLALWSPSTTPLAPGVVWVQGSHP